MIIMMNHVVCSRLPSQDLMNYCTSIGLPPPKYHYHKGQMVCTHLFSIFLFFHVPSSSDKSRMASVQDGSAIFSFSVVSMLFRTNFFDIHPSITICVDILAAFSSFPSFQFYFLQGMCAVVELANGFKVPGSQCRDRVEAAESASAVALLHLVRTRNELRL